MKIICREERVKMELIELGEDNLEYYEDYLNPDAAENIGRECYTGMVLMDEYEGETEAALIWEKKTGGATKESYTELSFFRSEDNDNGQEILNAYSGKVSGEIERSWFEFKDIPGDQRAIFEEAGFSLKEAESRDLKLTVGDLGKLKLGTKKLPPYVKSINKLSSKQFWQGIANALFCEKKGLLEDLDFLPESYYEQDISCFVEADGRVKGMLLVHETVSGVLMPVLFYANEPDSQINLLLMMRYAINAAVKTHDPDAAVIIRRHDDKTRALSAHLFPGKRGEKVTVGEREEAGHA